MEIATPEVYYLEACWACEGEMCTCLTCDHIPSRCRCPPPRAWFVVRCVSCDGTGEQRELIP